MRTHLPEVMSALAWRPSAGAPPDAPIQSDELPASAELAPEGTTPETPTSTPLPETDDEQPAGPGRHAARRLVRDTFSQELNRGIRKLAGRRYEIKRGTLELALGNLGALAKWVRVRPEVRDGKAFGFRLFAIKADGPFAKLGLQNDDVLVSINGLDLATPERALDAYGKLKESPRFVLGLIREKHETTQEYTIR
jgi:hypothetical protein